jgi:hypothetical protein
MCAISLFVQIYDEIEKIEDEGLTVKRFSVTGYSLGTLFV